MVSLWQDTAAEGAQATAFRAGARYDGAILGSGYTGLSTALHCAEKGLSACVLETLEIGFGGPGRNVGPVNAGLWLPPAKQRAALRRDSEGRLIPGSMGRLHGTTERGLTRRWASRHLQKLYPSLGPVRFASAWDGAIAMTPDHLPRIHRLAPGLWTPIAYNGRGITAGTVFGRAMADLLAGMGPDDLPLPVTDPQTVPRTRFAARACDAVFTAHQFWKVL